MKLYKQNRDGSLNLSQFVVLTPQVQRKMRKMSRDSQYPKPSQTEVRIRRTARRIQRKILKVAATVKAPIAPPDMEVLMDQFHSYVNVMNSLKQQMDNLRNKELS